jgi:ribosomal protein S17
MIDSGSAAGAAIAAAAPGTARANGLLAAGISQPNTSIGQLHKVDTNNSGNVVQTSVMTSVNTRTIIIQGNRIFAIAGINRGNAAIRLVEIHNDSLNMIKQGDDDISPNSLLWASGNSLYAITVVEGKSYLARFDTNLAKQAQSAAEVHTLASCIFQGDRILTQKPDGTPLVLNGQTLR